MRWVYFVAFVAVIGNCWGKAEDTNEIYEKQPPSKLDNNLRKALLKALSDLETDDKTKTQRDGPQFSKETTRVSSEFLENAVQKAQAASFIITQTGTSLKPSTTDNPTTVVTTITQKPIVVVQKSSGIQHRPITSYITSRPEFDPINDSEQFIASASNSFTGSPKYSLFKSSTPQARSVTQRFNPNLVSITEKPRISSQSATTVTPTITSSTEESEAKVEDVQFFAAPLVAAFTVHHDEQGLPKSVEPIYKTTGQTPVSTKDIEESRLEQLEAQRQRQREEHYKEEQVKLQQYLRQQEQLRVQFDLEEKQRILEQQIRSIQQQQQHQDYLLRQQQLFQEQNLLQQRQRLLEEQKTLIKTQDGAPAANRNRFNHQFRSNPVGNKAAGSSVSFEPSIAIQPAPLIDNTLLPPATQQLPTKSAQNFRQPFVGQLPLKSADDLRQPLFPPFPEPPFRKFNPSATQSPPVRNFHSFNFEQSRPQRPQSNRVFRHESGTGNFPNNDFYTRNNLFNPAQPQLSHSNRFFRSNPDSFSISPSVSQELSNNQNVLLRPPLINNQLNNLLYYSGITRGNQQEDLNIVSKVLSLNHLGAVDSFFGGSTNVEQRLLPPKQNKISKS